MIKQIVRKKKSIFLDNTRKVIKEAVRKEKMENPKLKSDKGGNKIELNNIRKINKIQEYTSWKTQNLLIAI